MDNDVNRNDAGEGNDMYDHMTRNSIQFDFIAGATSATVGVIAKDFMTDQLGYHCIMNPSVVTEPTEMPAGIFYDVSEDKRVLLFVDYSFYDDVDHVQPMAPIPLLTFGESRFLMKQIENLQSFFTDTEFRVDVLQLRIPGDIGPSSECTKVFMGYTKDYTKL